MYILLYTIILWLHEFFSLYFRKDRSVFLCVLSLGWSFFVYCLSAVFLCVLPFGWSFFVYCLSTVFLCVLSLGCLSLCIVSRLVFLCVLPLGWSFFVYCLSTGLGLSAADKEVYRLDTMAPSVWRLGPLTKNINKIQMLGRRLLLRKTAPKEFKCQSSSNIWRQ